MSIVNFFKGIVVGFGGIMPGLSGSVLMVIFGLYQKVIKAIGEFFKDIKNNLLFLIPVVVGCAVGILMFSKVVDYLLNNFAFQTRYMFLGLIIGTIPLFYKEVKKEGFNKKYYIVMAVALAAGCALFYGKSELFEPVTNPTLVQSGILGVAVAGSSIVPGVDSAAILSSLGMYELWVSSLSNFDLAVLIPAAVGLCVGVLVISFVMNLLIKHFYTATFSVIFGLFISIIPSVLDGSCVLTGAADISFAAVLVILGFAISYYLGDIAGNNEKIKSLIKK